jgi:pyochelin synthetase
LDKTEIRQNLIELEEKGIHIWTESGKLKYKAKENAMCSEILLWLKNNKNDIITELVSKKTLAHNQEDRYKEFPLTEMQNAYFLGRTAGMELGNTGCYSYTEFQMEQVDPERLEKAWHKLIMHHDMLRAVYSSSGLQKVLENPIMPQLQIHDFRYSSYDEFLQLRKKLEERDFEIGTWPMHDFQLSIFDDHVVLHFSIDMLIGDFISVNIIMSDLFKLYENPDIKLPDNKITYRDIVMEDRNTAIELKKSQDYEDAKQYWENKTSAMPGAPKLPVQDQIKSEMIFKRRRFELPKAQWECMKKISKRYQMTSSAAIMCVYLDVLQRWSSNAEFCINMTLMDRKRSYLEKNEIIGDFTTIDVFHKKNYSGSFQERARKHQNDLMEDLQNSKYSGVEVLKLLGRKEQQQVVIPVVYTSTLGSAEFSVISEHAKMIYGISRTPQVWIDCQAIESNGCLIVNWDVREGVLKDGVADAMFESFCDAIKCLAADSLLWEKDCVVSLNAGTIARREQINNTAKDIQFEYMGEGFCRSLLSDPNKIALVADGKSYSYDLLGRYIQAIYDRMTTYNVKAKDRIVIAQPKGMLQIAAVMAVIFKGAVYVPVKTEQSINRLKKIVNTSKASFVIGEENLLNDDRTFISLKDLNPAVSFSIEKPAVTPEQLAYIIFTSGSTGEPKGVAMSHDAAMNTIIDINKRFAIDREAVVFGISDLSFDLSVYDIFGTFNVGATLVLPTYGRDKDPEHWYELIQTYGVSVWNSVPALLSMLLDYIKDKELPRIASMECIMLSGDYIPRDIPQRIKKAVEKAEVYSLGGATEAAIWSIYYPITDYKDDKNIPYGYPLSNQRFYVLNDNGEESPDYVVGEICIAGRGLAKEYYGDEKLTAEKFPLSDLLHQRIYKTGDIGYYRDGLLEFVGRKDFQVKINGYRVELGEVESVLKTYPDVDDAVAAVFPNDNGRNQLYAFVVPKKERKSQNGRVFYDSKLEKDMETSAKKALGKRNKEDILAWKNFSENTAIIDMLWVFQTVNTFKKRGQVYTYEEIENAVKPAEEFKHIIKHWLRVLTQEDVLLRTSDDSFALTEKGTKLPDRDENWAVFKQLEDRVEYSATLWQYQKHSSDLLLEQIRGEVKGLDLLFPEGDTNIADAAYHSNVVNSMLNEAASEAVQKLVINKAKNKDKVRILEIGAGVGGTTRTVVENLQKDIVKYTFTDVSNFFINKAKQQFKDCDFMDYRIYDINTPFEEQDLEESSYDIILAANVLHNSRNLPNYFKELKRLLKRNGTLVLLEAMNDFYSLLTSVEMSVLKSGEERFTDNRKGKEKIMYSEHEWEDLFMSEGMNLLASFPPKDSILNEIGQKVFVVQANSDEKEINIKDLKKYMEENLISYMVPTYINVIRELPLSSNGKIDRKKLKPVQSTNEQKIISNNHFENKVEETVARIWEQVLNISPITREDNFYAVGGDSLLIAQVATKLKEEFKDYEKIVWDDLMRNILRNPTVSGMASIFIGNQSKTKTTVKDMFHDASCIHFYQKGDSGSVIAFFHTGTGRLIDYHLVAPLVCKHRPDATVIGLNYGDEEIYLMAPVEELITTRAMVYANVLQEMHADSYKLAGYCVGGFLALETAKILIERGLNVEPVVTISSHLCRHKVSAQMLLEANYGAILGADIVKAGYPGNPDQMRRAISYLLNGVNRDIDAEELCSLKGEFEDLGMCFKELSKLTHMERMSKIYECIENPDFAGDESSFNMLNILFDVFERNFIGMIHYEPDFFTGDLVALIPDEQDQMLYPNMKDDVDWDDVVLGKLTKKVIHGNHNTCIQDDRIDQIIDALLEE